MFKIPFKHKNRQKKFSIKFWEIMPKGNDASEVPEVPTITVTAQQTLVHPLLCFYAEANCFSPLFEKGVPWPCEGRLKLSTAKHFQLSFHFKVFFKIYKIIKNFKSFLRQILTVTRCEKCTNRLKFADWIWGGRALWASNWVLSLIAWGSVPNHFLQYLITVKIIQIYLL